MKRTQKYLSAIISILIVAALCLGGCSSVPENGKTYSCSMGDAHAIEANGKSKTYSNVTVEKTGDSVGDEADFYGTNSAVYACNGAELTISDSEIHTSGVHANAVFSYGQGTVVNISNSVIETEQATSGGIMVTGGGSLNAADLTVTTHSGSSAPIRSDRGGGQLNVSGGTYQSFGSGSPAVYSTADIRIENASLYSDISEAIVVEGKNSVTIMNSDVTGKNTVHNSDKADLFRNVMIYQSMSGDAEEGRGEFSMAGGSLTAENGCMFFVTNTIADIYLENVDLHCAEDDLLRIEKAGWGNDGSNGGQVTFAAANQSLSGRICVDDISALNMYLKSGSSFTGSISSAGKTYVELDENSTWTLTADTEISGLSCNAKAITLNGYSLKVNGKEYEEGTESVGEAIEIVAPVSSGLGQIPPGPGMEPPMGGERPPKMPGGMNDGQRPPDKPDGNGTPPDKPDGNGAPPDKPDGNGAPPDKPNGNA